MWWERLLKQKDLKFADLKSESRRFDPMLRLIFILGKTPVEEPANSMVTDRVAAVGGQGPEKRPCLARLRDSIQLAITIKRKERGQSQGS